MKNEFTLAFNQVLEDKQLPRKVVIQAIEDAMVSAYRKAVNAPKDQPITVEVDPENGKVKIFVEKEVVESVIDDRTEVTLEEARQFEPEAELGQLVMVESTPRNFGRVAAQNARQVIQQKIREAEREEQFKYFSSQVGEIVNGIVQAMYPHHITLGLEKKAEGILPRKEQIGGERFKMHERVRALLLEVKATNKGPQIILSRAHKNFLRRLLEDEVPEIYHGQVEIRSIAREPGQRSKVSVFALQPGIDPVGACVGVRGVRIQAIVRELNDEKIDVIEWNPEPREYIAKALSPARVLGVYLDKHAKGTKTATVVVPEDQLSLAIGRDGQNARLAAKLTSWRIDIKSLPEAATDALLRLQVDPSYAPLVEQLADTIPQVETILSKKAEGRPLTPEEYHLLTRFVDQVERRVMEKREEDKQAEIAKREALRATIPPLAFETPIEELGISPRLTILLGGEGFPTVGDLLYQLALDADVVLAINGIGPKAMEIIEEALARFPLPELTGEEEAQPAEAEAEGDEAVAEAEEAVEGEVAEAETAEAEPAAVLEAEPVTSPEQAAAVEEAVSAPPVEAGEGPAPEAESEAEAVTEEGAAEQEPAEAEKAAEEEDFERMFSLEGSLVLKDDLLEGESEEEESTDRKKKKKRKKKYVELEYDPDLDVTLVRRKRKRGAQQDWLDEWEEDW